MGASPRPGARFIGAGGSEFSAKLYREALAGRADAGETFPLPPLLMAVLTLISCC